MNKLRWNGVRVPLKDCRVLPVVTCELRDGTPADLVFETEEEFRELVTILSAALGCFDAAGTERLRH